MNAATESATERAGRLLDELAPLTNHDRMRRMVALGQRIAAGEGEAAALADALAAHANPYPRLMALQTVFGSRDGARVIAALSDPSALVRRRARRMTAAFCDDAQIVTALDVAPRGRVAASLCRKLRRRKRTALVDAFLAKKLGRPTPGDAAPGGEAAPDGASRGGEAAPGGAARGDEAAPDRAARGGEAAPARGGEVARDEAGGARFDGRVVDLLPFGSAEAQAVHAVALREAGSPVTWCRQAVWQPESATAELIAFLTSDRPVDPRSWWKVRIMLPALTGAAPDAALKVTRAVLEKTGDPTHHWLRGTLSVLARRRPAETFDILRAVHESSRPAHPPGAFGVVRFVTHTERLGAERIAYLVKLGGAPLPDRKAGLGWFRRLAEADRDRVARAFLLEGRGSWGAFVFRHVAPDHAELGAARERAFVRWREASQRENGTIDVEHLAWLPADLRIREARRHLEAVADLANKPRERMLYAKLLPFAEAKEALAPWLGHPEGEERAAAQRVWIGSVRFERASLAAALEAVKARKFEQDPVRLAMLDALGQLPLATFRAEHLEAVGQVVQHALDAADLSHPTARAAETLVVRLFRRDAAWGARWLAKLLETRGSVSAVGLGDGLTEGDVKALAPAIAGLAQAWLTRERASALLWLATSLGRRLVHVEDLVLALELCAQDLPYVGVAAAALELLARHAGERFAALVPRLLAEDRTFAIVSRVARFVSHARQDLLDPLLDGGPMTGRFATGRTAWVLDFGGGFARWTDRQQAKLARGLGAILADGARDVPAALSALEALVELAFVDPAAAIALASDPRPPVRERAVRYLPRLDGGEGLPVLIDCLGDDRARFAIYALRKAFEEKTPAEMLAALAKAPLAKVTVAKEVLRLTGELPGEQAFRLLLSFDRPDLHRDVRIALLRALWDHLDRDEAWAILERAALDPDWIVAARLIEIPVTRLSARAEARLARLFARVVERPEVEARIQLLLRIAGVPLRDAERAIFGACLLRMAGPHPDEAKVATAAVLQRMAPEEAEQVIHRMAQLVVRRRLVLAFLDVVTPRLTPHAAPHVLRIGEGLLGILRADTHLVPLAVRLASRLLGWKELGAMLVQLAEQDLLHVDAMVAAFDAVRSTLHPQHLEALLAREADPRLRRLAVEALAGAAGPGKGWSAERRERLQAYRSDPSPLVAGAAELVLLPD